MTFKKTWEGCNICFALNYIISNSTVEMLLKYNGIQMVANNLKKSKTKKYIMFYLTYAE